MNNDKKFTYIFIGVVVLMLAFTGVYLYSVWGGGRHKKYEMNVNKTRIMTQDSVNINQDRVKSYGDVDSVPLAQKMNVNFSKLNFIKKETKTQAAMHEDKLHGGERVIVKRVYVSNGSTYHNPNRYDSHQNQDRNQMHNQEQNSDTVLHQPRMRTGFNDSQMGSPQPTASVKNTSSSSSIYVVVHNEQTVMNGSTVRLRATSSFMLNGIRMPRNTFITGIVNISGQRVMIHVPDIEYNGRLYSVDYDAYDGGDGLKGANAPDLMVHDATKEEINNGLDNASQVRINTPIVSVPIPVNAGRKRVEQVKADLAEDYKLILMRKK